jgi:hypothetical protein
VHASAIRTIFHACLATYMCDFFNYPPPFAKARLHFSSLTNFNQGYFHFLMRVRILYKYNDIFLAVVRVVDVWILATIAESNVKHYKLENAWSCPTSPSSILIVVVCRTPPTDLLQPLAPTNICSCCITNFLPARLAKLKFLNPI